MDILIVGIGGFIGTILRYLMSLIPVSETTTFPIKTLGINIAGCILIGVVSLVTTRYTALHSHFISFLKIGICGGFTAFSSFALDAAHLIKHGHTIMAILYILTSVIIGIGVVLFIIIDEAHLGGL